MTEFRNRSEHRDQTALVTKMKRPRPAPLGPKKVPKPLFILGCEGETGLNWRHWAAPFVYVLYLLALPLIIVLYAIDRIGRRVAEFKFRPDTRRFRANMRRGQRL